MSNRDAQEFSGREAMNRDEESLTPTAYPDQRGYRNDPISTEDKENSLPETVTLSTEPFEGVSKLDGTSSDEWDATGDEQNKQRGNQQRGNQQRGDNSPYQNQNARQGNSQSYQSNQPSGDSQSGLRSDDLQRGINAGPDVMPPGGRSGFESGSNRSSGGSGGQSDNVERGINAGAEAMPPGGRSGFESGSNRSSGGSGDQSDNVERGINAGAEAMPPGGTSGFDSSSRTPQSGKELFDSPNSNNQTAGNIQAHDSKVQRRPDTTTRDDKEASNQRADMMDTTVRQDKDLTYMSGDSSNAPLAGGQTRQAGTIRPATKDAPSLHDSHYETGAADYVVDNRSNSLDGDDQGYNRTQGGTTEQHHPGSRDRA